MSQASPAIKLGRPKSKEKRKLILQSATTLFLQQGFSTTSMDLVAKAAGVSKQTVYSHFNNKDDLYTAVIDSKCSEYRLDSSELEKSVAPFEQILLDIATQTLRLLQDSAVIAMYTVVIGEANNNPRVAELFYRAGPQQFVDSVALIIKNHAQIALSDEQARSLATDFFNLLKGDFHMRSILKLPFTLTPEQQQRCCERVCQQVQLMLQNINALN